jgi:hypothetical protein
MRAALPTLIDPFELNSARLTPRPQLASLPGRQSIDLEIDWEEVRRTPSANAAKDPADESVVRRIRRDHDWNASTEGSTPGVSCESWHRARGWCAE